MGVSSRLVLCVLPISYPTVRNSVLGTEQYQILEKLELELVRVVV